MVNDYYLNEMGGDKFKMKCAKENLKMVDQEGRKEGWKQVR